MARVSLSKNKPKLKLTREQTSLFQKIILAGNQMANLLAELESKVIQPAKIKEAVKLAKQWQVLMVKLVRMLI